MNKYYIYRQIITDKKGKKYYERMYYKVKVSKLSDTMVYVGEALLSDDYFIIGAETKYSDIVDLNDVEVQYTASLKNDRIVTFKHSVQELLERAKEGILPYISFSEHRVNRGVKLIIKGKLHEIKNRLDIIQEEEY